jgi:ubiquinone/menaquinone biosynthesis C-methylase UbiE
VPGVNFDRAASFYDATRTLPLGVIEQARQKLLDYLMYESTDRWLEIGIGTGRVALPFLAAGDNYTGIDLSLGMMSELQRKLHRLANARPPQLAKADAMQLPFRARTFDRVMLFHVLHLVDDWMATLHEGLRVLKPNGWIIVSANERMARRQDDAANQRPPTPRQIVDERWRAILTAHGAEVGRPRGNWRSNAELLAGLAEFGVQAERLALVEYTEPPQTIRQAVGFYRDRIYSSEWNTDDQIHVLASKELEAWLNDECPNPDEPFEEPGVFAVLLGRRIDE